MLTISRPTNEITRAESGARSTRRRSTVRLGIVAAVVAAAVNLAVYALAEVAGVSFEVSFGAGEEPFTIDAVPVALTTLVPLVVATALAAAIGRSPGLWRGLQITAGLLTLVSLGGPLSLEAESGAATALATMHVVAGAALLTALQRARGAHREVDSA